MKNLMVAFVTLFLMVAFSPAVVHAASDFPNSKPALVESAEMQALKSRINEIKALDKSTLSRAEKKDLRNELKDIKKQYRQGNNGIYLSLGAIIVIILLLILIL